MKNKIKSVFRIFFRSLRKYLPKTNFPFVILSGKNRRKKIFTNLHDYPSAILGITERELLLWFSKNINEGENWLDIGANYGKRNYLCI